MKRILALIILTNLIGLHGYSQEKNFLVGGSLGFKYSNSKPEESPANAFAAYSNTYRFSGSPIFGYFISNNINLGLAFDFRFQNTKYKDGGYDYIKQTDFIVSPFIRFYIHSLFILGQVNFGNSRSRVKGDVQVFDFDGGSQAISLDSDLKHVVYGFGIGLGYAVSLSDQIRLEPMIRYVFDSYKGKENAVDYNNSDILINLGLVYEF